MEEKNKKRKTSRFRALVCALSFATLSLFSLTFSNVNALSVGFIQTNDYTFMIGNVYGTYVEDSSLDLISITPVYLSFSEDYEPTMKFSYSPYPDNAITYATVEVFKDTDGSNSQYLKYLWTGNATISAISTSDISSSKQNYTMMLQKININCNYDIVGSATGSGIFNKAKEIRHSIYRSGNTMVNRYAILDSEEREYFTIYFHLLLDNANFGFSRTEYTKPIVSIDRSEQVVKEVVYTNPTDSMFLTIMNGVNSFLGIEILPKVSISSILMMFLGLTFTAFMLHLVVK